MFLLGKDYETCKSCETLKIQLDLANAEKKDLTATLLSLLKPKVFEAPPSEVKSFATTGMTFAKRRSILEARDREEAKIRNLSSNLAKEDKPKDIAVVTSIENLEQELGIPQEQENVNG